MAGSEAVLAHLSMIRESSARIANPDARRLLEKCLDAWAQTARRDAALIDGYVEAGPDPVRAFRQPVLPRSAIQRSATVHSQAVLWLVTRRWLHPLDVAGRTLYSTAVGDAT